MYDYKMSMNYIIKRTREAKKVSIVGAAKSGKQLLSYLCNEGINVEAFYDNNEEICGKYINNVKVISLTEAKIDSSTLYIIASVNYKEELKRQLVNMGVPLSSIIYFYGKKGYDYFCDLEEEFYEEEIQDMYYRKFFHYLNLKNPSTYNEKINWQKLYDKNEKKTYLADKYLVRTWVDKIIGKKYLTHLYGIWDDEKDIDFLCLPAKYVLKLNHGSGWNIIVKGNEIDKDAVRKKLGEWRKLNYAYYALEMHYKNIKPKIICEEYLEDSDGNLNDYKVFCFHGEPKYIMFLAERTKGLKMAFYDIKWRKQPFVYSYPMYEKEVPRPDNLDEMLELSSMLSKGFPHVRVDWYDLPQNRLVFGEMTFSSLAGLVEWKPEKYDQILGNLI